MIVQQVPAQQNAYRAIFVLRGETCFCKSGRLSRYCVSANANKTVFGEPEKRDDPLFFPVSRHKSVLFAVRQIVLKVILQ